LDLLKKLKKKNNKNSIATLKKGWAKKIKNLEKD